MSADFFYNRISIFLSMRIDCISNITKMSPWFCSSKTKFKAFFCDFYETFSTFGYLSDFEHSRRIRKISIENGGYVNIDDVTFLQNDVFIRDTMANFVVNRSTYTLWESFII